MERLRSEAADVSTAIDLEFGSLANSLVLLLEAAKSDLEHDHEAAKTSLATASSILQSEIERRSGLQGASAGGLAGWQIARVRSFIDKNLHRTIHASDLSAVARRSTAHFSRSFKQAFGEPPHAYIVRRRLEEACHLMVTSSAIHGSPREIIEASVGARKAVAGTMLNQADILNVVADPIVQTGLQWRLTEEQQELLPLTQAIAAYCTESVTPCFAGGGSRRLTFADVHQ